MNSPQEKERWTNLSQEAENSSPEWSAIPFIGMGGDHA